MVNAHHAQADSWGAAPQSEKPMESIENQAVTKASQKPRQKEQPATQAVEVIMEDVPPFSEHSDLQNGWGENGLRAAQSAAHTSRPASATLPGRQFLIQLSEI